MSTYPKTPKERKGFTPGRTYAFLSIPADGNRFPRSREGRPFRRAAGL